MCISKISVMVIKRYRNPPQAEVFLYSGVPFPFLHQQPTQADCPNWDLWFTHIWTLDMIDERIIFLPSIYSDPVQQSFSWKKKITEWGMYPNTKGLKEKESKTSFLEKEQSIFFFFPSLFLTNGTLYENIGYLCFLIQLAQKCVELFCATLEHAVPVGWHHII